MYISETSVDVFCRRYALASFQRPFPRILSTFSSTAPRHEFSMRTKSCLKQSSLAPSLEPAGDVSPIYTERRKSVTFSMKGEEDIQEEVFYADEWDRSPIEATPKLTYR